MALLGCGTGPLETFSHFGKDCKMGLYGTYRSSSALMTTALASSFATFFANTSGASNVAFRSAPVPEWKLLFLIGGGLIVLAALVRKHYPLGQVAAPKSMEVLVWISPAEIAEHLSGD